MSENKKSTKHKLTYAHTYGVLKGIPDSTERTPLGAVPKLEQYEQQNKLISVRLYTKI